MKTKKSLALLLLVALLGSGCATVSALNAEYEEEMTRVENMSPEERAEWEKAHAEKERINWNEFVGGGDE
jgi:uncharacterized protein YceK